MKRTVLTASAVVLTGLLGIATSSHGQNQNRSVSIDVAPLTTQVSYSTDGTPPLETFVAYRMSFSNTGGNTITGLSVTFNAVATDPAEVVSLLRPQVDLPAGCTAAPSGASFTCTRAQLRAGEGQEPFVVFLRAPVKVVNGDFDDPEQDYLNATVRAVFKEGENGNNPVGQPSVVEQNAVPVLLGTSSPVNIKSVTPKALDRALTLFTATNEPVDPTLSDQITTRVTIPQTLPKTAELQVQEAALAANDPACLAGGNFVRCYESTIQLIDPLAPLDSNLVEFKDADGNPTGYLLFELRIDPAAIKNTLKTNRIRINYDNVDLGFCVETPASGAPVKTYLSLPCVVSIDHYKNRGTPGWTLENAGKLVAVIRNNKNGRITIW